ncbi:hypothetical protein KAW18_02795 [candidate division WOR-3 bacterium]|nr:hypothetical protein [candidate division WOR-3 bacterium]
MNIKKEDIKTFLYKGNDKMIDFGSDKIPLPPSVFKALLCLKNGKQITAPTEWRIRIWNWWYAARKAEIEDDVLIQAAYSMLGRPTVI